MKLTKLFLLEKQCKQEYIYVQKKRSRYNIWNHLPMIINKIYWQNYFLIRETFKYILVLIVNQLLKMT